MGWLLELLFGAIREMCSQFIIDMMDVASSMFTEILSCDLNLFEDLFGVVGDLYKNAVMPIGIMLLLMILVWQLFKSMFGKTGIASEDPLELIFRSAVCLILIAYAKQVVNYILDLAGTPYQWVVGTAITVDSFSAYVSASEAVVSALGIDSLSISMLLLIMQFVVAWNYFKMLFILAERYVLLGVFSYTAPLAFATGGSKSTNGILASWVKMFGGQVLIVILDAWCVKMFLSAYGNLMASSYGFTKFFAATMCLIGFCKITAKLDSYMGSLGVNLGRTGGGLGGLGALMMVGRLLRAGTGLGSPSAAKTGTGDGAMNFGTGKGIPLGTPGSGKGAAAAASGMTVPQGTGIGGLNPEGAADANSKPLGQPGMEDMPFVDDSSFGADSNETMYPFGNPDDMEAFGPDGMMPADGMNEEAMTDTGRLTAGQGQDFGEMESGMLPSMDMEGGEEILPFGNPDQMALDGTGEVPGMEDALNPVSGWQEDGASENLPEMGTEFAGMEEISAPGGTMDTLHGASVTEDATGAGIGSTSTEAIGGYPSMEEGGTVPPEGEGADSVAYSQHSGAVSEQIGSIPGAGGQLEHPTAGTINQESLAGERAAGMAGNYGSNAAMGTNAHGEGSAYGAEGSAGKYGRAAADSTVMDAGMYPVNRDGEQYIRYDAAQYEKPKTGEYQTIHENGKTFYELPEKALAPAMLPEVKATLEKDGTLHLEKTYQKSRLSQKEIRTVPEYHAGKKKGQSGNQKQGQPQRRERKKTARRRKNQDTG